MFFMGRRKICALFDKNFLFMQQMKKKKTLIYNKGIFL